MLAAVEQRRCIRNLPVGYEVVKVRLGIRVELVWQSVSGNDLQVHPQRGAWQRPSSPPRAFGTHPLDTDFVELHLQLADMISPQARTVPPRMQPARLSRCVRRDQSSLKGTQRDIRCQPAFTHVDPQSILWPR